MPDTSELERLHELLRNQHEQLAATKPGSSSYARAAEETLATTMDLLNSEARVAAEIAEEHRGIAARRIRIIAASTVAALAASAIVPIIGWASKGWLSLLIALAVFIGGIGLAEPSRPRKGQGDRQLATIMLAVASGGAVVLTVAGLTAWWVIAVVVVAVVAAFTWVLAGTSSPAADADATQGR